MQILQRFVLPRLDASLDTLWMILPAIAGLLEGPCPDVGASMA